jgi:GNAT superfamily N-acetyltransferase
MTIRPARADEAAGLSALAMRSKAHWGYAADFLARCRAELSVAPEDVERHPAFVAVDGEAPVGFCTLVPLAADRVELGHLYVEPTVIGRGVGRMLLTHAGRQAARLGYETLVIASDPHAVGFYETYGARRVGETESASIPGRSLPLFELGLRARSDER